MLENTVKLLSEISQIKNEESSFNPFDANFGRLENTHSDIIAKLLEPKWGFLDGFVKKVGLTPVSKNAKIIREKDRIDILIEDGKNAIIIENKIRAGDQPQQLVCYHTKTSKRFDNITLIYLTLFGHSPSEDSKGDLENIKLISYQNHILSWLDEWYEANENNSDVDDNLKSFIKLYIEQIRNITNNNKYMIEILEKVFGKDENNDDAKAAIELYTAMNSGINVLTIPKVRKKIEDVIEKIVSSDYADDDVDKWDDTTDAGVRELFDKENEIIFFTDGYHIYAKDKTNNPIGAEIVCNTFNNNLQNLLTENKEGIKQWLDVIYDSQK